MDKEKAKKKFDRLLTEDVQNEMQLRALLGAAQKTGLMFYEVATKDKDKAQSCGLKNRYFFVTSDKKKAAKVVQLLNGYLKNKQKKEKGEEPPKFDCLFEVQEKKLQELTPDGSPETLKAFMLENEKAYDLIFVEAQKRLSILNKGILKAGMRRARQSNKNEKTLKAIQRNFIKRLYRAQVSGKKVRAQIYDREAPSQNTVQIRATQQNRERER